MGKLRGVLVVVRRYLGMVDRSTIWDMGPIFGGGVSGF
jgi:hypothetical protein